MIRKGTENDIGGAANIFDKLLEIESVRAMTGWEKNVYPTKQTFLEAYNNGEFFVIDKEGAIVSAAIINQKQVDVYADCQWEFCAPDNEIMVIHTLGVDPDYKGKGYASDFIKFYESYALENGCKYLRFDTNETNTAARRLYKKLGYREAGIMPCVFHGIKGVNLVCLEKKLD